MILDHFEYSTFVFRRLLSFSIRLNLILLSRGAGRPSCLGLSGCLSCLICASKAREICKISR